MADAPSIPYELVHLRLQKSDEMRRFALGILQRNPHLALTAGTRVNEILKPLPDPK
jgi:hypothetical protein